MWFALGIFIAGTAASAVVGYMWARFYLARVTTNGAIPTVYSLNRPVWDFVVVVSLAFVGGLLLHSLIIGHFESQILKQSKDVPVTEYVLQAIGFGDQTEPDALSGRNTLILSSASSARETLAESLKSGADGIPLERNQLYQEFISEMLGDVPGVYLQRDSDIFVVVQTILGEMAEGGDDYKAHGEFYELLGKIEIQDNGRAQSDLIPLPNLSMWSMTHQKTVEPRQYLRIQVKPGENGVEADQVWQRLFNYVGPTTLSFEDRAERLAFLSAYLRQYNAMFSDTLTSAALIVGPVQLALTVLFFLTVAVLSMRLTLCASPAIREFIATRVAGKSAKVNSWEAYIENVPYAPINFSTWAIPSIGFIGTVFGIKLSLGSAELVVSASDRGEQILAVGKVTELLSLAFDTTLVALVLNVFLMCIFFAVRSLESRLVHS